MAECPLQINAKKRDSKEKRDSKDSMKAIRQK